MPSRAPLTDEEMQALRDRMERYEAAKSTRTPPPAPSQTFGMRTHSARRTGPRQRYDPQAAAEARHADRMRLMELRKAVLAQQATEAEAKRVKVQAVKDARPEGGYPANDKPKMSPVYGMSYRDSDDPAMRRAYWKERGIDSPGLSNEERSRVQGPTAKVQLPVGDRPISSMYSVTPNQYQDTYGVPFTGSDPDSMRRLLALQNGTASVIGSERKVMDQQSQDAFDSRPANPNPPAFGGLAPITTEQQLAQKRGVADRAKRDFEIETGETMMERSFTDLDYLDKLAEIDKKAKAKEYEERARAASGMSTQFLYGVDGRVNPSSRKEGERAPSRGGSHPPQTSANR